MANIWNIASKGLLATGISGFPVGVSSFVHSSQFSSNKKITGPLEQSTKFLNEEKDKLTKTKNKENTLLKELEGTEKKEGLKTQLAKQNKEIASGIDDGAEGASKSFQTMMKRGIYSCQDKESKGLTQVTEIIKFGEEEKEITYCYYSECDGKLFFKNNFGETLVSSDKFQFLNPEEGCFSASLKHDKENKKITGSIKFGLKTETWKDHGYKIGALLITTFELHKDNKSSDRFKNTFIVLQSHKHSPDWAVKEKQEWDDSHKGKYTYDYLKNKSLGEFKELKIWNIKNSNFIGGPKGENLIWDMPKTHLNFFDQGSDLWDWSENNAKNKNHFHDWTNKIWWHLLHNGKFKYGVWKEISLK